MIMIKLRFIFFYKHCRSGSAGLLYQAGGDLKLNSTEDEISTAHKN